MMLEAQSFICGMGRMCTTVVVMLDALSRTPEALVVVLMVVGAAASQQQQQQQQQQGPLVCWSCTANTQGPNCYDLDHENKTFAQTCSPEEVFCLVNRIWYVVEAGAEARNFSVNRTCADTCSPSCVVIGDRTKIHSCTSCCTTSYCNIGSSASAQPMASTPLVAVLVPILLLGGWLWPVSPLAHSLPAG